MGIIELQSKAKEIKELMRMKDEIEAEIATLQDEIKAELTARKTDEMIAGEYKFTKTSVTRRFSIA
ncbi:MAG: hypothetical protein BWY15_01602 [Firmicutes bacterium ADurb.Bin193]|nr:MAG: hypothetical protein BWY15_01602 [Firmicutes bacterium ADurb.Bin193]